MKFFLRRIDFKLFLRKNFKVISIRKYLHFILTSNIRISLSHVIVNQKRNVVRRTGKIRILTLSLPVGCIIYSPSAFEFHGDELSLSTGCAYLPPTYCGKVTNYSLER